MERLKQDKKKHYETILFDLDGTLTESGVGIVNSVHYALCRFGIEVDKQELYRFVGPPLRRAFSGFYGLSESDTNLAIRYYREYYTKKGIYENDVYDGVQKMLSALKEQGKRLMLATAKPEPYARQIMEHFDLGKYFEFLGGSTLGETRTEKHEVIAYVMETCGITDPDTVLMVGDRSQDVTGGHKAGVDVAGVLYGYGSREELEEAGADYLCEKAEDILRIV